MERGLIEACQKSRGSGTSPVNRLIRIFGKNFSPAADEIYWTHALKCLPLMSDKDIQRIWKRSAPSCAEHFKAELDLVPSRELVIVSLGGYALALCRYVLQEKPLDSVERVTEYIKVADTERRFVRGDKEVFLFPFLHPANRERVLKQLDEDGGIQRREEYFTRRIQQLNAWWACRRLDVP